MEMNYVTVQEMQELKKLVLLGAKQALTTADAALLCGLSKSHIYKLVCSKSIPYYKSSGGKLNYFDRDELEKWMLKHRVPTSTEVEQQAAEYLTNTKRKTEK